MSMPENSEPNTKFNTIEEALTALRAGSVVIVVDAQERENEGDYICAAETMTPQIVDFMLKHGRGVLCVPMVKQVANRLRLSPLVQDDRNTAPTRTHFLTPVDHCDAGTGVSAENRAHTIRALADPESSHDDFIHPGHINPLLAKEGGVLRRHGHTEASIDLLRMAGMRPVGALIEICSPSGYDMADAAELHAIAVEFNIPIITIEELIRYRRIRERLVERAVEVAIPTKEFGKPTFIAYSVAHEDQEPLAIVWGDLASSPAPLVRMHSSCFTGDLINSLRCDCGDQLHMAMSMIHQEGTGAVIYLPQEGRGIGLTAKLKAYTLQDEGCDTAEANQKLGYKVDHRDFMIGLQILKDLGLSKVRLLTNNPKKADEFQHAWDITLVEQVPIIAPPQKEREKYLATKRDKMGHLLPPEPTDG